MSSYPSSIAVFPTHSDITDTIFAADVNTPNAEIVAIETGLLNGTQHNVKPLTDDTYTLGDSGHRWLKLWGQDADLDGTVGIGGALTVGTTLGVNGVSYTWPASDASYPGSNLQSNGSKVLSWVGGIVRAYNSANESISNNTVSLFTCDTHDFDTTSGAFHSTSSNTSRFIAATAGKYRLTYNVAWAGSAGGTQRQVYLRVNGSGAVTGSISVVAPSSSDNTNNASVHLNMNANDYVEVLVYQDSGGALNLLGGTGQVTSAICFERVA